MKKTTKKLIRKGLIELAILVAAFTAVALCSCAHAAERTPATRANNDTTLVAKSSSIRFESETLTNKAGESRVSYFAIIDGKVYPTNKTSVNRYALIKRFGGEACLVYITNKNTNKTRVTAL